MGEASTNTQTSQLSLYLGLDDDVPLPGLSLRAIRPTLRSGR